MVNKTSSKVSYYLCLVGASSLIKWFVSDKWALIGIILKSVPVVFNDSSTKPVKYKVSTCV